MPITSYTGLPRSGKSYGVLVNIIIPALKQERDVYCNIPVNAEKLIEDFGSCPVYYDVEDIKEDENWFFDVLPKGCVFVIDEAYKLWPQGMRANMIPEKHKSFLAEHGHMVGQNGRTTEIIIVTQDLAQLAHFPRSLVENTYRAKKLSEVGKPNSFRVDCYSGPVTGPKPPEASRINQEFYKYEKKYFGYYKSHTMSDTGKAGDETKMDNRASYLRSGKIKMLPFAVIFFFLMMFGLFSLWPSMFGGKRQPEAKAIEQPVRQYAPVKKASFDNRGVFDNKDLSIIFNNGFYPSIDYVIEAREDDNYFTVGIKDIVKLGYSVQPINQCLVKIFSGDLAYFVTCRSEEVKENKLAIPDVLHSK